MIVGPTGSGKTGVGIEIAKKCNGEVISADSRTIYKGMDIGTAKPNMEERQGIRHYGFDLVEPGERYTVADWKKYAEQKICSIREEGKTPIIVGGTGLYVDALIFDYKFTQDAKKSCSDRKEMNKEFKVFGVKTETEELRERLKSRIDKMFNRELFDEVEFLAKKYGWDNQAMKSNIYKYAWQYLCGDMTIEEAKEKSFFEDYHLAKRQMTWFRRNKEIIWLSLEKIELAVLKYIQDE